MADMGGGIFFLHTDKKLLPQDHVENTQNTITIKVGLWKLVQILLWYSKE